MSKKIAATSECMIELSEKGVDAKCGFGGDTLSTSVYIARQVDPVTSTAHYVTALGTDSLNQQMSDAWCDENVDTSLTQRMENRPLGLYYIETDSTGECTFYYWYSEVTAKFQLKSEQSAMIYEELANSDYLYLSGIGLVTLSPISCEKLFSLLRECHASSGKVIFNNNHRPCLWASKKETRQACQQVLECTDTAFPTLDDEDTLWGQQPVEDVIVRTRSAGAKEVVVKRGADSCLVSIANGGLVDVPAVKLSKEKVIDTTAADDSFSAGYLVVRLTGGSVEDAAKCGHLIASTVIQYRGAITPREAMPA